MPWPTGLLLGGALDLDHPPSPRHWQLPVSQQRSSDYCSAQSCTSHTTSSPPNQSSLHDGSMIRRRAESVTLDPPASRHVEHRKATELHKNVRTTRHPASQDRPSKKRIRKDKPARCRKLRCTPESSGCKRQHLHTRARLQCTSQEHTRTRRHTESNTLSRRTAASERTVGREFGKFRPTTRSVHVVRRLPWNRSTPCTSVPFPFTMPCCSLLLFDPVWLLAPSLLPRPSFP